MLQMLVRDFISKKKPALQYSFLITPFLLLTITVMSHFVTIDSCENHIKKYMIDLSLKTYQISFHIVDSEILLDLGIKSFEILKPCQHQFSWI